MPNGKESFTRNTCNCGGRPRIPRAVCNTITPDIPPEGPDLDIYSQELELRNGRSATWNNPDITTNDWNPFRLRTESTFKVRNISPSVAAIGAKAHFFTSPFGIGMRKEYRLTKTITIGAGSEKEIKFPLDPASLNGDPRVGAHLQLEHPHDKNQGNNYGSQVHDQGHTSRLGRDFILQVPVLNDSPAEREIRLSIAANDLLCSVIPANYIYQPHQQLVVAWRIVIPDHITGTAEANTVKEVTLVGRLADNTLLGGITMIVCIDN